MTVDPAPVITSITASPDVVCAGEQKVILSGTATYSGGSTLFTTLGYYWSGPTAISCLSTPCHDAVTIPTVPGVDVYTLIVTDPDNGCTAMATVSVTVNPIPVIDFVPPICMGGTTTLTATVLGAATLPGDGTWSSSDPGVAIIDPGTGVLTTSLAYGTATITYTLNDGCYGTITVSVMFLPTIKGDLDICVGSTTELLGFPLGGAWSSSVPGVATVAGIGDVTGVSAGTTTIAYTTYGIGCVATAIVTVAPSPTISATTLTPCEQTLDTLVGTPAGGTWSGGDPVATIDPVTGIITILGAGTGTFTYTSPAAPYCTDTITITVIKPTTKCACDWVQQGQNFYQFGGTGSVTGGTYTGNYFVDNDVIIYGVVNITNAVMVINDGVTIAVDRGTFPNPVGNLQIMGSHLFSCYPQMWRGINVGSCSSTTMLCLGGQQGLVRIGGNSLIEDAAIGVNIQSPSPSGTFTTGSLPETYILQCDSAVFNKDSIGISIGNDQRYAAPGSSIALHPGYPYLVANTVFTSRNFYPFQTSGTPTVVQQWPFVWPVPYTPILSFIAGLKNPFVAADPYHPPYNIDNPTPYPGAASGYLGTPCNYGFPAYAGIVASNVGGTFSLGSTAKYMGLVTSAGSGTGVVNSITDPVLYDTLNYGIYAVNSNVMSRNSSFIHMAALKNGGGIGIYSYRTPTNYHKLYWLNVEGTNTAYNNKFYDCATAVGTKDLYYVKGRFNFITSTQSTATTSLLASGLYGFNMSSSNFYLAELNNNYLYNIRYGINYVTTPPGGPTWRRRKGEIRITNNYIGAVNPAAPASPVAALGEYVYKAISVQNLYTASSFYSDSLFPGSQVNLDSNHLDSVYNGIYVSGSNNLGQAITSDVNAVTVAKDVTYTALLAPQAGITHVNTDFTYIYNNTIYGPGYDHPIAPAATGGLYSDWATMDGLIEAVHVAAVQKNFTECNLVSDINTGFYFGGLNTTVHWKDNTMQRNAYGYALDGIIGTQPAGSPPTNVTANDWEPAGFWVIPNWQTYTVGTADPTLSWMYVYGPGGTQDPANNLGDIPFIPYIYAPGNGIAENTNPAEACTPPPTSGVPFAAIHVDAAKKDLGYTTNAANKNWIAQMVSQRAITADTTLDTNAVLSAFQGMATSSRYQHICTIESGIDTGDYASAATELSYPLGYMASADSDATTGAVMADSAGDNVVSNYTAYYGLLVKYMTDTLNAADSAAVTTLANKCPYVDGSVVYHARALYSMIYDDLRMFNDGGCDPVTRTMSERTSGTKKDTSGSMSRSTTLVTNKQRYTLSPNPSNGRVTLTQLITDANPVNAEVLNGTGEQVLNQQVIFESGTTQLDISSMPPGLYLLRLTDSRAQTYSVKFVIVK